MSKRVLVVDAGGQVVANVSRKRGLNYILSEKGVSLLDSDEVVSSASVIMPAPSIVLLNTLTPYRRERRNCGIPWTRRGVLQRDKSTCAYCSRAASTVDHIVPKSKGGRNEWLNTVAACLTCNSRKGDQDLAEFGKPLRYLPRLPINDDQREFLKVNGYDHVLADEVKVQEMLAAA